MRKLQLSGGKGEKGGLRRSRDLAEGRHRGLGYPRGVKMGRWGEEPGREPREGTEFGETSAQGGWSGSLGRRGHPQREPGDGWGGSVSGGALRVELLQGPRGHEHGDRCLTLFSWPAALPDPILPEWERIEPRLQKRLAPSPSFP